MARRALGARTVAALLVLTWMASGALASPIPSRAPTPAAPTTVQADRDAIQASLARREVAAALAAHGLSPRDVELRVAQLSPQDLSALAAHLDQVQAAGNVPQYIWILLAILLGVTILAAVF